MGERTLGAGTPLRRAPAVLAESVGGTTVLLDPVGDRYVRLNGTGAWVFERLAEPATPEQLAADLVRERHAPPERALDDVLAFARDLVRRGVVETDER